MLEVEQNPCVHDYYKHKYLKNWDLKRCSWQFIAMNVVKWRYRCSITFEKLVWLCLESTMFNLNLPFICLSFVIGWIQYLLCLRHQWTTTVACSTKVSVTGLVILTFETVFILNLLSHHLLKSKTKDWLRFSTGNVATPLGFLNQQEKTQLLLSARVAIALQNILL